jgi:hypothetical protein
MKLSAGHIRNFSMLCLHRIRLPAAILIVGATLSSFSTSFVIY